MAPDLPKHAGFAAAVENPLYFHPSAPNDHLQIGRRYVCCCLCFLPALIFLLLAAHFTITLFSILHPFVPSFRLDSVNATITGITPVFDGDGAAYVSATADVVISIWNEEDNEIQYSDSKIFVSMDGDALAFDKAVVPGFWQAARSSSEVKATVAANERYLTGLQLTELEKGRAKGEMVIDVDWEVRLDLVASGEVFRSVPVNVACDDVRTSVLLTGKRPRCTAKLLGL